jgi:Flp pilus assembly protein TadG
MGFRVAFGRAGPEPAGHADVAEARFAGSDGDFDPKRARDRATEAGSGPVWPVDANIPKRSCAIMIPRRWDERDGAKMFGFGRHEIDETIATERRGRSALRGFGRDARGGTALMFAMLAVPMVLVVGGGVDFYEAQAQKAKLQQVLDSAVLAGSKVQAEGGDGVAMVATYVEQNYRIPSGRPVTESAQVDTTAALLSATASTTVPANFLTIIGMDQLQVTVTSAATYGGQRTEVAIALDVTGSMNSGTKLADAKAAAKDLVDILFTVPGTNKTNGNVKIGVVPFAQYVALDTSYRTKSWMDVPADSSQTTYSCQQEWTCTGKTTTSKGTCYSDGIPYTCTQYNCSPWVSSNVCKNRTTTYRWYGCVGSRTGGADLAADVSSSSKVPGLQNTWCNSPLTRLTTNKGTVVSAIETLSAGGETYIAPGVLWAWRVLSPNLPFQDGDSDPVQTPKYIVLMTDGANTLSANGKYHNATNVAASNDMLVKTCTNAKAAKINIYTIAFDVTDATIKSLLSDCASGAGNFYDSRNGAELKAAFKRIGEQITSRRLVY